MLQEERNYILQMVKKIKASGANVLLIQKSILRDAVTDLSLHYLVRADGGSGCIASNGTAACLTFCQAAAAAAAAARNTSVTLASPHINTTNHSCLLP